MWTERREIEENVSENEDDEDTSDKEEGTDDTGTQKEVFKSKKEKDISFSLSPYDTECRVTKENIIKMVVSHGWDIKAFSGGAEEVSGKTPEVSQTQASFNYVRDLQATATPRNQTGDASGA